MSPTSQTFTVTLPTPAVDYILTASAVRRCTPGEWVFRAILRHAQRGGDEARRALWHRRRGVRVQDVDLVANTATIQVIDVIDRLVQARVAAVDAAGDDGE